MNKKIKDITGQRFGSLVAKEYSHSKNRLAYWKYQCDCGNTHIARANTISYEYKKKNDPQLPSCGCVELTRKTKHGYRKVNNTHPAYKAYRAILTRCYNINNKHYQWYGAQGVTICDEWKNNPQAFVEWSINNGWSKGLHIDKDILCKAKGIYPHIYSPETCQWVIPQVNVSHATNRTNYGKHPNIKLTQNQVDEIIALYNNKSFNGIELAKLYGVTPSSIYRLLKIHNGSA